MATSWCGDGKQERWNADERKGTQMNANGPVLNAMPKQIIGCAFTVANALGCGFLENVYKNALAHELRKAGPAVMQHRRIDAS